MTIPTVPSTSWQHRQVLSVDLETTGPDPLDPGTRIVQFAQVLVGPAGNVIPTDPAIAATTPDAAIVNPGIEIPENATNVHGITTERAQAEGLPHEEAIDILWSALATAQVGRVPVVIFNASYDLTILDRHFREAGRPTPQIHVIDPLVLDRHFDKYRKGKRTLEVACQHYRVSLDGAHDASADAVAAARVAYAMARIHPAMQKPAEILHKAQVGLREEWRAGFEAYLRRVKGPGATVERGWPILEAQAEASA